ncbi:MAG: hypothetical protein HY294_04230 [Candidatus Rokubacteria bacterium]|nr:hypothetical protein [Candidatus Rokubacteria bacterium]MBI3825183.1 hypothetical protein [Candidatus Rokubacteria bacterium]
MSGRRRRAVAALAALAVLGATGATLAQPADDRLLPADQHTSDKARTLAQRHVRGLRALNAGIYHCIPWVEVRQHSIGFFRPRGVTQDDRFLAIRLYIEQDTSPEFGKLSLEDRASAMFSRYVGAMLRRMNAADATLISDPLLDGYSVVLEWRKQGARGSSGDRPIHETIAAFMPKSLVADFLAGRLPVGTLADTARVLAWDGERAIGQLRVTAWDDNFVSTFKVANYQLDPGISCG